MFRNVATLLLVLVGSACSTTQSAQQPLRAPPVNTTAYITPEQAVFGAGAAAPGAMKGVFVLEVRGTGRQDGNIYLNSEADYRDQRNLTVAVRPPAIGPLAARFGADPDVYLKGRRITVSGFARRVRIDFTAHGLPTGKYYYQTHVEVVRPEQITVLNGR